MRAIDRAVKRVIAKHGLHNWLADFPWLKGYIGDPRSAVWFIGENPSMQGVVRVHSRDARKSENLQWNSHDGDRLLREAITEAKLKQGSPDANVGWHCYITNAIKGPEVVAERNARKRTATYWKTQAEIWMPVLQRQIELGNPRVLVALGGQSTKILRHMVKVGLRVPVLEQVHHYSYIMLRPEAGTNRGPRHPDRVREFKESIFAISMKYGSKRGNG